jgi:hypothetical protein
MPAWNLYNRILAVMANNPDLLQYKSRLFGSCCRRLPDNKLMPRLQSFVLQHPEFKEKLEHLLSFPVT